MARSKKVKEEAPLIIYVMKNNTPCSTYGGNTVVAKDSKEKLEQYKQQLIDNGYENVFTIEEQEHQGWSSVIRYSGFNLVEHEGLLYTQNNVDSAQRKVNGRLFHLKQMIENLTDFKANITEDEQKHYDIVITSIKDKYEELRSQKLEIKMA